MTVGTAGCYPPLVGHSVYASLPEIWTRHAVNNRAPGVVADSWTSDRCIPLRRFIRSFSELRRSCVKVEVALIVGTVSVDVKQNWTEPVAVVQSSGAVWKSRWPSLIVLMVSVDVKQHWTRTRICKTPSCLRKGTGADRDRRWWGKTTQYSTIQYNTIILY